MSDNPGVQRASRLRVRRGVQSAGGSGHGELMAGDSHMCGQSAPAAALAGARSVGD